MKREKRENEEKNTCILPILSQLAAARIEWNITTQGGMVCDGKGRR